MGLSPMEIILVVGVVVLLFGAKKIPDLAKGLGTGIKEFKKATKDEALDKPELAKPQNTEIKSDNKPPTNS
jgi:sec-independent protein translocase protein TatA